jgi:hypothetical protein
MPDGVDAAAGDANEAVARSDRVPAVMLPTGTAVGLTLMSENETDDGAGGPATEAVGVAADALPEAGAGAPEALGVPEAPEAAAAATSWRATWACANALWTLEAATSAGAAMAARANDFMVVVVCEQGASGGRSAVGMKRRQRGDHEKHTRLPCYTICH